MKNVLLFLCVSLLLIKGMLGKPPNFQDVSNLASIWSRSLGDQLWNTSLIYSRRQRLESNFREMIFSNKKGTTLQKEIAAKIENLLRSKIDSVANIGATVENLSKNRPPPIETNSPFSYFNADTLNISRIYLNSNYDPKKDEEQFRCETNERRYPKTQCPSFYDERAASYYHHLPMNYDKNFGTAVNTNYSVVKVAPSVYWRQREILNDVRMSEALTLTFKKNMKDDPSLSWQYFASPKGFMRLYPAMKWPDDEYDKSFDFRKRSWFTEAMTSPKDVIILLDISGSMSGINKKLSRYVVNNILDTLSINDFVNLYLVDNGTTPLVECFGDGLVQANEENLKTIRDKLYDYKTAYKADLELGLKKAFRVLFDNKHRYSKCSQAVMIVTAGLDYTYKADLFEKYPPDFVRIFTFQIGGSQLSSQEALKDIACHHLGYYVNIFDASDAHEKVFKYLLPLSRLINLKKSKKVVWSDLYANLADRRLSSWLWKKDQGKRQREHFVRNIAEVADHEWDAEEIHPYELYPYQKDYKYMVTASMPVLDERQHYLELLGVSAVDIPLDLIYSTIPHYKLGVNGYAFIVTNNGHVILHPDHKKEFDGILKPSFDKVDLLEVEMMDDQNAPRDFDKSMLRLRREIVQRQHGKDDLNVRMPLDNLQRVLLGRRHYYYGPILGQHGRYSLVVALPEKHKDMDVHHLGEDTLYKKGVDQINLGDSHNWTSHPNWHYCRMYNSQFQPDSYTQEMLLVVDQIAKNRFKYNDLLEKYCDSTLVKGFFADLKQTSWFDESLNRFSNVNHNHKEMPLIRAFLATRSGLTRWQDVTPEVPKNHPNHFKNIHDKAIDEVWYRRAAEAHHEASFVYSVPLHSKDNQSEPIVTAASVIHVKNNQHRVPVAATGYQFYQKHLAKKFDTITNYLHEPQHPITCGQDMLCFLLDDNAYIIVGREDNKNHVGRFFGDLHPDVMNLMVKDGLYKRVRVFDYQAVCLQDPLSKGRGIRLLPGIEHILSLANWAIATTMYLFQTVWAAASTKKEMAAKMESFDKFEMKKKIPVACDQERYLYILQHAIVRNNYDVNSKDWRYVYNHIPRSNLVLVIVNALFKEDKNVENKSPSPKPIEYKTGYSCLKAGKNTLTRYSNLPCFNVPHMEHEIRANRRHCGG